MNRRLTVALAAAVLVVWSIAKARAEPIYARLVVPIFFETEIPQDIERVRKAVNQITQRKIGASVELVPLLFVYGSRQSMTVMDSRRSSELEMLRKRGIRFDVLPDVLPNTRFIAVDDLLERYGKDILGKIDAYRLDYDRTEGRLSRLPSVSDYVASVGVTMRKDIVDRYAIDVSRIRSVSDLECVFASIAPKEPQMKMISPYQTRQSFLVRMKFYDAVPSSVVDVSHAAKILNGYATDQYRAYLKTFRQWYERGYVPENMALQNIRASQLVKAGELFAYFCAYKPGIDYEESTSCERVMITVPLAQPAVTRRSLALTHWGIADTCKNPGKAMQFLNLLYGDGELVNLLVYGIEGVHYVRHVDGTIEHNGPQSAGYRNTLPWLMPNQELTHVPHGYDPRLWEELRGYNRSAAVVESLEFVFDAGALAPQNEALNAIANRYAYGLETGQLDPDVYLPRMLAEMDAAGIERVIKEAQLQYDKFLERRKTLR